MFPGCTQARFASHFVVMTRVSSFETVVGVREERYSSTQAVRKHLADVTEKGGKAQSLQP